MREINLSKCTFNDCIALDEQGIFNDAKNGEYGYRVFYTVPKEELEATGLFSTLPEECIEGELEFSVDGTGKGFGEVLLWLTLETEENGLTNEDFVYYEPNIDSLRKDFYRKNNFLTMDDFLDLKKGDEIEFKLGEKWICTKCICDAFYNSDSDEPNWEVETRDGYVSIMNEIILIKKHTPKEFTIQLSLTEADIECLEEKFGTIKNEEDAKNAVIEAIQTYLELA